jgi:hypothetical protein
LRFSDLKSPVRGQRDDVCIKPEQGEGPIPTHFPSIQSWGPRHGLHR